MEGQADAELVALARRGHKEAFGVLIERYQAMARRIAIGIVAHEEIARELAQEAMLQAYFSLDRLRDAERFRNWLCGIVLNVCRSYVRNQKADYFSLEALTGGLRFEAIPVVSMEPDPQEAVEARELHQLVMQAVNALSPKNREATLLFYYEQLSLREIAAILGVSVTAVKGRLHKSRTQLREQLLPVYAEIRPVEPARERRTDMVQVTIADIVPLQGEDERPHNVLTLLDEVGQRFLSIWIGPSEAEGIGMSLLEVSVPRPMTYTFIANLLEAADTRLEEVRVEKIENDTFYAIVSLRQNETVLEVDARPSDAVNLALVAGCPIYVAEDIMESQATDMPEGQSVQRYKGIGKMMKEVESRKQPKEPHPEPTEEEIEQRMESIRQNLLDLMTNPGEN